MSGQYSPAQAIANDEVPMHAPGEILHRERELKEIREAIKPLFEGRQHENLLVYGVPGTGKSLCVMRVLQELEAHSSRVKVIRVNCWQHSTRMAIYSLVAKAIDEMMPRRGLARDEVYDRIIEMMEKNGIRVLLVLDNIGGLFRQGEDRLLDDVCERKKLFGVIGITNDARLPAKVETKLSSLEFRKYDVSQMRDILTQRAKEDLAEGTWNKEIIEACARKAKKGNARMGLDLLFMAAKSAQKEGKRKISLKDVGEAEKRVCAQMDEMNGRLKSLHLSDEERIIIDIVKTGPKSSSDLYRAFFKRRQRSKRQIRNYIGGLEARKLLCVETVAGVSPLLNTKRIELNSGMGTARDL